MQEQKLETLYDRLNIALKNKVDTSMFILDRYKNHFIIKNPYVLFDDKKNKIEQLKVKVELLNPNNILDKGYSIIYKDDKVVKNIDELSNEDKINIKVKSGNIDARIEGVNKNE